MTLDPRTPVLVGVGQWSNRVDRGEPAVEPAELVAEALRRAADDSGAGAALLRAADAVRIVSIFSIRYRNAAALVASRIGAEPRDAAVSPVGGNQPQVLVHQACHDILAGDADVVLIGGAEAWRTRSAARASGTSAGWTVQDESVPLPRSTGPEAELNHPAELQRGIAMPTEIYPLFEQALRHRRGRSIDEQLDVVGALWSGFSQVAAANPHAWVQQAMTPAEVRTAGPDNRWVTWPYTKVMCANNAVEQGAGLILCSAAKASALGIARDRWVFPLAGTEAHDTHAVSHRGDLHSSPAIRLAGRRLFDEAGLGIDDVAHVDLYSCFPSAVEIAADELGLSLDRSLTVTGGLSFAGGPWNDYVGHSIAAMAGVLREDPGSIGLVTANGGYVTKHALGLYSTEPPAAGRGGFRWADVQDEVDAQPTRAVCTEPDGAAVVESWAVTHARDGSPEKAVAACLLDDGRRAWGVSTDADTVAELRSGAEQVGRTVKLTPDGELLL